MRTVLVFLLLAGTLRADVLVLKDGRKLGGKVADKGSFYEVTTEGGLKTFLRDEVEKVLAAPDELLGDSAKVVEESKQDYLKALEIADPVQQNVKLKETVGKLAKARESYAGARELFWEDKYSDLDKTLVQIMQLLRLLRERVGSEIARAPGAPAPRPSPAAPPPPPPPAASPEALSLQGAFAVALDPAQRGDGTRRTGAHGVLRAHRTAFPGGVDLANAAMTLLSRPDKEWRLEGAALAAFQDYAGRPWAKEPAKLDAKTHLEAARWIGDRLAALRKADANASADALLLFAMGHLSHATPGADREKTAQALGLVLKEGVIGTLEGHAIYDLGRWIERGDYDLAVLSYQKEARNTAADTPGVRFLWSYALLRLAQQKKRGYERPAVALGVVKPAEVAFRDHTEALAKSVKNVAVCSACSGEAKTRCTSCHGKKEVRTDCATCKGVAAVKGAGGGLVSCRPCQGRGYTKLVRCDKCKDGYPECRSCDRKPRTPPEMEDICMSAACPSCDGAGLVFQRVLVPCRSCMGLGQKLTPRADPSKVLP